MAIANSLNLTTILFLLLLALHSTQSSFFSDEVEEDDEIYVLDNPAPSVRPGSRVLASIIKKGTHCNNVTSNVCNGVSANKGKSLLYCCKKHCRNILGDRNNCGQCGRKCGFGQLCCNGVCTDVAYNVNHCGKCNKKCPAGVPCDYGTCGYA